MADRFHCGSGRFSGGKKMVRYVLNVDAVEREMVRRELTRKAVAEALGMKDPHTFSKCVSNPDKVRLDVVSAMAEFFGADDLIVRTDD